MSSKKAVPSFARFNFVDTDDSTSLHDDDKQLLICVNTQEYDEEKQKFIQKKPTSVMTWGGSKGADGRLTHKKRRMEILVVLKETYENLSQNDQKWVTKDMAVYRQTYSLLRLVEPIVFNENNLTTLSIFYESGDFKLPVKTNNVFVRLSRTKLGSRAEHKNIAPERFARVNIRVQYINPNAQTLQQWTDWLNETSMQGQDGKTKITEREAMITEIKSGRKKPILENNGHKFVFTPEKQVKEQLGQNNVTCSVSNKVIIGPLYICEYCKIVVRVHLAGNTKLPSCTKNLGGNINPEAIVGRPHTRLINKRVYSSKLKCAHSGSQISWGSKTLFCEDCGRYFLPQYATMLIPNCGEDKDELYTEMKNDEENAYGKQDEITSQLMNKESNRIEEMTLEKMANRDKSSSSKLVKNMPKHALEALSVDDEADEDLNVATTGLQRNATRHQRNRKVHKITSLCLDDFQLINKLGEGAYGLVLGARLKKNRKLHVALKVISKRPMIDTGGVCDAFNEEYGLKIATEGYQKGECLNLCTFEGCWQDSNRIYFAMEFLPNNSLFYHCAENPEQSGRQSVYFCQYYATEIARGITYLHKKGIIHRDMKLENVVLDADGYSRIIDFGVISKEAHKGYCTTFIGTPNYMAPEIIQDQQYSVEVDWWALGVMIYEMHMNRGLFNGNDENTLFRQICGDRSLVNLNSESGMEFEIANVLGSLLNREPKQRLSWRKRQTKNRQPLNLDPFFIKGAEILSTNEPPISLKYVADEKTNDELDNIYVNRSGAMSQRVKRKDRLLPPCTDTITEEENEEFRDFGIIMGMN